MTSRLTTRSDTPTASVTDRIVATQTTCRTKAAKHARSEHLSARTKPHAAKPAGVTMDYQQGFTSGPSM